MPEILLHYNRYDDESDMWSFEWYPYTSYRSYVFLYKLYGFECDYECEINWNELREVYGYWLDRYKIVSYVCDDVKDDMELTYSERHGLVGRYNKLLILIDERIRYIVDLSMMRVEETIMAYDKIRAEIGQVPFKRTHLKLKAVRSKVDGGTNSGSILRGHYGVLCAVGKKLFTDLREARQEHVWKHNFLFFNINKTSARLLEAYLKNMHKFLWDKEFNYPFHYDDDVYKKMVARYYEALNKLKSMGVTNIDLPGGGMKPNG